ncbi:MAG: hypothetical protein Ct9H300mP27_12430 [Chloroflexota bacterium]|nr:MAG: hypothetical protein Ct9H300mP27_12430 [Chloroflexota bacterium]
MVKEPKFFALVLKGVRVGEDARIAAECGVEGILVSTHGGRQLDQTMSSLETVPEIVDAVKGIAKYILIPVSEGGVMWLRLCLWE